MEQPFAYFNNNVVKTLALLEAMLGRGVKKFILSSTAALFGTPDSLPITADAPIRPESVYGETKYMIERSLAWLQQTQGLGYTCLRYFNVAGASHDYGEDHRPESHLIPLVLQVAQGKRDGIKIFGDDYPTADGSCIRDYIHVRDLADAHILALEQLQENQAKAYNLGSGAGFSVKEIIEVCRQVTGHPIPAEVVARRLGDPAVLVADAQQSIERLAWQPQMPELERIVASAWDWHQRHPQGYGDS